MLSGWSTRWPERWYNHVNEPHAQLLYEEYLRTKCHLNSFVEKASFHIDIEVWIIIREQVLVWFNTVYVFTYNNNWIIASPDGLVMDPSEAEIKFPARTEITSMLDLATKKEVCSSFFSINICHWRRTIQVQGQLHITRHSWFDFVVWTPTATTANLCVDWIRVDHTLWKDTIYASRMEHHKTGQPVQELVFFGTMMIFSHLRSDYSVLKTHTATAHTWTMIFKITALLIEFNTLSINNSVMWMLRVFYFCFFTSLAFIMRRLKKNTDRKVLTYLCNGILWDRHIWGVIFACTQPLKIVIIRCNSQEKKCMSMNANETYVYAIVPNRCWNFCWDSMWQLVVTARCSSETTIACYSTWLLQNQLFICIQLIQRS